MTEVIGAQAPSMLPPNMDLGQDHIIGSLHGTCDPSAIYRNNIRRKGMENKAILLQYFPQMLI